MRKDASGVRRTWLRAMVLGAAIGGAVIANAPPAGAAAGGPIIEVTPLSVDFGGVQLDVIAQSSIQIKNRGLGDLVLAGLTVDDPDFTVGGPGGGVPPGTIVEPDSTLQVEVAFRPTLVGPDTATLNIFSNDPLTPTVLVALSGSGASGARIQIMPATFSEIIDFGDTLTRDLVIRSVGDLDLTWTMSIQAPVSGAGLRRACGDTPSLQGIRVLWDQSHGQSGPIPWSIFVGELEDRGAEVVPLLGTPGAITAEVLSTYRLYFSTDPSATYTAAEKTALTAWAQVGGGLMLVGDNSSAQLPYNELLTALGAGITVGASQSNGGVVASGGSIAAHEATAGVDRVFYQTFYAKLDSVNAPAETIIRTNGGDPLVAVANSGIGRVAVVGDELFFDDTILEAESTFSAANRCFGNQLIDWLAGGLWLRTDLSGGTLAAGDSVVAHMFFDTEGLGSGAFDLKIQVTSNDSVNAAVDIPVHLEVTGAPEISVNPTLLVFDDTPAGNSSTMSLEVTNTGTEVLNVTGITSSTLFFSPQEMVFSLGQGEIDTVAVSFFPDSIGAFTGTLTIESDAVLNPEAEVIVNGNGVVNCVAACGAPSLRPLDVEGSHGFQFWLDVAVDSSPLAIGGVGFDLNFDPAHMTFAGAVNWDDPDFFALASEVSPGRVRVGGFSSPAIPSGFSGSLLQLLFSVDCDTCTAGTQSDIFVSDLVDGLVGLAPCCGQITLTDCPAGHGDVNADSTLTATDALCANLIWINGNTVPSDTSCHSFGDCEVAAADVNCSGGLSPVSPQDALHIYDRALCVLDPVPVSCFAQSNPDPCGVSARQTGRGDPAIFFGEPQLEPGTTVIAFRTAGAPSAFGLELVVPVGLEFMHLERGEAAAEWTALEARTVDERHVRVGGFDGDRRGVPGELLRLVFAGNSTGEFEVTEIVDAVFRGSRRLPVSGAAPTPDGIRSVHPNPAPGSLTISLGLAAPHQARELRVVDVAGRLVRRLPLAERGVGQMDVRWDGRDTAGRAVAAGVYFVALRLDERLWTRKVLLVR